MELGEGNQRPRGRQSYSRYRPPVGGPGMPMRRPIVPQRATERPQIPVESQHVQSTSQPNPVFVPEPSTQQAAPATNPTPAYSAPRTAEPSKNVTVLKPVWSIEPKETSAPASPYSDKQPRQPEQAPVDPNQQQPEQSAPLASATIPVPLTFEAPAKPKRSPPKIRVPKIKLKSLSKKAQMVFGAVAGLMIFGGVTYGLLIWQASRSDPQTVLRNGLMNHLSLQQVEVNSASGQNARVTAFDFSNPKDPVVTSRFVIQQYGSSFDMSTYGDNMNTFVRYNKMPDAVSAKTRSDAENKWVQIRTGNKLPVDASHVLSSLADPRAQIFGPIIYGNFDDKTKEQLADFMIKNRVYKLESQEPAKTKIDGKKVIILPVALDVGYLKVAIQSAALGMGYSPNDVAEAVRAMDFYKGAKADVYITTRGHNIVKMVITPPAGAQTEVAYKNFDKQTTEPQPVNAVQWKNFASLVWQIDSQAASKQQPQILDANRKAALDSLSKNLASYKAQKGYYPTLANINDLSWLSGIALGAPEMQRDPLAVNLLLSATPTPSRYAYVPAPAGGTGNCDNVGAPCQTFKLVSTLSDGKQYLVQNP